MRSATVTRMSSLQYGQTQCFCIVEPAYSDQNDSCSSLDRKLSQQQRCFRETENNRRDEPVVVQVLVDFRSTFRENGFAAFVRLVFHFDTSPVDRVQLS